MAKVNNPVAQVAKPISRSEINRKKREERNSAFLTKCENKYIKVPRGTGRAKRRELARKGGSSEDQSFPEVWANFRAQE